MITTRSAGHPKRCANCASAYCRSRDSRFSNTCCGDDCRTYTMARRLRCRSRILEAALIPNGAGDDDADFFGSGSTAGGLQRLIMHLSFFERRGELSKHDLAERDQRSM